MKQKQDGPLRDLLLLTLGVGLPWLVIVVWACVWIHR